MVDPHIDSGRLRTANMLLRHKVVMRLTGQTVVSILRRNVTSFGNNGS